MNVEIGTEAALFPEEEYINGIAVAVWALPRDFGRALHIKKYFTFFLALNAETRILKFKSRDEPC